MNKATIQQRWWIYLAVNINFLTPTVFCFLFPDVINEVINALPFAVGYVFSVVPVVLLYYQMFRITYVHLVLAGVLLIYYTVVFIKNRELKPFLITVVLIAASAVLNAFWSYYGMAFISV